MKSPGGELRSEPCESTGNVVALQSDLAAHARKKTWSTSSYPPPASAPARLNGGADPAPAFPLRTLDSPQGAVRVLLGAVRVLLYA